jgi:anti-anti-sigma regulatory factor
MTMRKRPVSVVALPQQLGSQEVRAFLHEMSHCLSVDRPQLVVDCSTVDSMDNAKIHLLLCCLEEAMKRNGDVKLAGLPADDVAGAPDLTQVDRLFESYEDAADAVNSFHQLPSYAALGATALAEESAA